MSGSRQKLNMIEKNMMNENSHKKEHKRCMGNFGRNIFLLFLDVPGRSNTFRGLVTKEIMVAIAENEQF